MSFRTRVKKLQTITGRPYQLIHDKLKLLGGLPSNLGREFSLSIEAVETLAAQCDFDASEMQRILASEESLEVDSCGWCETTIWVVREPQGRCTPPTLLGILDDEIYTGEHFICPACRNRHQHRCNVCDDAFIQCHDDHRYCSMACRKEAPRRDIPSAATLRGVEDLKRFLRERLAKPASDAAIHPFVDARGASRQEDREENQ